MCSMAIVFQKTQSLLEMHGKALSGSFKISISYHSCRAMLYDKDVYPEPHVFRPERFLKDGKLNPNVRDVDAAFGFGR